MTEQTSKNLTRRDLLTHSAKAVAAIAAAGAASYLLYDSEGPDAQVRTRLTTITNFSVPHRRGDTISIVKGADRAKTLRKAIDLLGGIGRFVKPGELVLIKPNVAFASPARLAATSHPELIAELVRLCYAPPAKARQVLVADNPINDPASCFRLSGIAQAAGRAGAKIVLPRGAFFQPVTLKGGRLITSWPFFYEPVRNIDKVIGVTPVKNHHRSGASMTMKNWYGLLGGQRNIFHQDINTIIAELAMLIKPTLVVLDGIEVMMTNGPTGGSVADLMRKNTIVVSCDQVAADAFGAGLLGLKTTDLPYLHMAQANKAGTIDYESLEPVFGAVHG